MVVRWKFVVVGVLFRIDVGELRSPVGACGPSPSCDSSTVRKGVSTMPLSKKIFRLWPWVLDKHACGARGCNGGRPTGVQPYSVDLRCFAQTSVGVDMPADVTMGVIADCINDALTHV